MVPNIVHCVIECLILYPLDVCSAVNLVSHITVCIKHTRLQIVVSVSSTLAEWESWSHDIMLRVVVQPSMVLRIHYKICES